MSSPQVSATGLSSIVRDLSGRALKNRTILDNTIPAQFHSKFWGTSMAVEESEWRSIQTPVSEIESDGDRMDDEIDPGCYMLDIGIRNPSLPFRKIWIRAEYIRVFDYVQQCYDRVRTQDLVPAVVITGQPGIGKTFWNFYAIRRCLSERKPVIWYRDETCYLFLEKGVYELPQKFNLSEVIWTFVDSDEAKDGVPDFLARGSTRHFNIYSTSPNKERWSGLHKSARVNVVVMNPWTVEEIFQVATLFPDRKFTNDNINEIFDQFAPIPRVCLDYQEYPDELDAYKKDVTKAIAKTDESNIEKLIVTAWGLRMDTLSHTIFLVRRANDDDLGSLPIVSVITPTVHSRLAMKFRDIQQDDMIRLYQRFASEPEFRRLAGIIYEAFAQCKLQNGLVISLLPMVKLEEARGQYYSSHVELMDLNLEGSRKEALKQVYDIEIKPVRHEMFTVGGPSHIQEGIFYLPAADNHEANNSFILLNNILYIFQFAAGWTHGIKISLIPFFEKYKEQGEVPPISSWRFVFIIDSNLTLICPQPWQLKLQELPLYSAVVEVPIPPSQAWL